MNQLRQAIYRALTMTDEIKEYSKQSSVYSREVCLALHGIIQNFLNKNPGLVNKKQFKL